MALLSMPGILVNEKDKRGKTILQYAKENGHKKCLELLQKSLKK
ncbi:ankyrin repeat domain-containing protein [Cardinium endosymbiont of Bemisia tabaci]|nr:ankyrin repeat domain-containing protein [Cardinium endosymbiont of Bemisia tabaci]CDG50391.1 Ankyrin repeats-containing protein [Cardinium endosymbiont cBtQ1 of Bemisia tabaci]